MEVPEIARIARNYAVMVRIQGPDPKGLKMRRHPFHHHQDGKTTISASGLLLPDSLTSTLPILQEIRENHGVELPLGAVVVTTASVVESFLPARRIAEESFPAKVLLPKLIPEAHVDILIDQGEEKGQNPQLSNTDWLKAQPLALVEVPAFSRTLQSLVRSHSGSLESGLWDVGWSLAPQSNGPTTNALQKEISTDALQKEVASDLSSSSLHKATSTRIVLLGIMPDDPKDLPHINISQQQNRGDLLVVMGSPFGILSPLHFINSVSVGAVANCCHADSFGISLLMADIRCLPGMEGAPVFDKHVRLVGILTRPIRQKGSSTEIHLVITWNAIANACSLPPSEPQSSTQELCENKNIQGSWKVSLPRRNSADASIRCLPKFPYAPSISESPVGRAIASVVLITVGDGAWASGIILNNQGLILTNAHLLEPWRFGKTSLLSATNDIEALPIPSASCEDSHQQSNVHEKKQIYLPSSLSSSSDAFKDDGVRYPLRSSYRSHQKVRVRLNHTKPWIWCDARVIYISKGPVDVASVQLEHVPNELFPISVDYGFPSPGLKVHVIGHGPFGPRSGLYPFVSSGVVAKVVRASRPQQPPQHSRSEIEDSFPVMLETTAAVYPGMSGGAVLNSAGHMIGLVTSNAKHGGGTSIPEMNFSIPCAALEPIFKFSVDQELSNLEVLDMPNAHLSSVWALKPPPSSEPESLLQKKNKEGKGSRFSDFLVKRNGENASYRNQEDIIGKLSNKIHSKM